jgi:hypothetical protein
MSKGKGINYVVAVLCAGLALLVVQGLSPVPTTAARTITSAPGSANLEAENRTLEGFLHDLADYHKLCNQLDQKDSVSSDEYRSAKTKADGLNGQIAQAQRAFGLIIDKLKDAKEWGDFDATAYAKIKDKGTLAFLHAEGGAKHVLETAASQTGDVTGAINTRLERLKKKQKDKNTRFFFERDTKEVGWRIIEAGYAPPKPAAASLGCFFHNVVKFVSGLTHGGCATSATINSACTACGNASILDCSDCNLN